MSDLENQFEDSNGAANGLHGYDLMVGVNYSRTIAIAAKNNGYLEAINILPKMSLMVDGRSMQTGADAAHAINETTDFRNSMKMPSA